MPLRTFIALDLDEAVRRRLVDLPESLDLRGVKLKWVEPQNLHVTLNFLGDVPNEMVHDICNIASAIAAQIEPFEFSIFGAKCVPGGGQIRMIWAGVEDPSGRLAVLQDGLARAFEGLGLRQEMRGYKPHITLARIKHAPNPAHLRRSVGHFSDYDFGSQHADEVVAYCSQLSSEGPIYTPIARCQVGR